MKNLELGGVVVPAITPVDGEDQVDEAAFRKGLRRLVDSGVQAIFVGGSAGEGPLLTEREWERMVSIAHDEVRAKVHLLGVAIDTSARRVRAKMRILNQLGYPFCVITPTYYITLRHPDEYMRLFGECAEWARGMEIIAYNIPSCTGSVIPADRLIEMARRGWIRYLKESSGDFEYFHRLVVEGTEVGLRVLEGEEPHIARGMLAGAAGVVPVCANFEPSTYIAAYEAGRAGEVAAANALQGRINEVRQRLLFAGPLWIAGIKYAMSLLGVGSGRPVSPLQPLTAEQKATITEFTRQTYPGL